MSHAEKKKNIAVCLFGLNRSLSLTHQSILEKLIAPFHAEGHVGIYGAFLQPQGVITNFRSGEYGVHAEDDYSLLKFNKVDIIDQAVFDREYRVREIVASAGDCYHDEYRSAMNICRALYSMKSSYECARSDGVHDIFIFARPDLFYIDRLSAGRYVELLRSDPRQILTPAWQQWAGLNDRIAITSATGAAALSTRFDQIRNFIELTGEPLHAESMLLWHAISNGLSFSNTISERAIRVRANGVFQREQFQQTGISEEKIAKYTHLAKSGAARRASLSLNGLPSPHGPALPTPIVNPVKSTMEASGRVPELPAVANIDWWEVNDTHLKLGGWALVSRREPIVHIEVRLMEEWVCAHLFDVLPRPDVQAHFPLVSAHNQYGFVAEIVLNGPVTDALLHYRGVTAGGERTEILGSLPVNNLRVASP